METTDAVMSGVFIAAFSLFGVGICGYCIYRQKFMKKMKESRSNQNLTDLELAEEN
jgi:hypothetical protein